MYPPLMMRFLEILTESGWTERRLHHDDRVYEIELDIHEYVIHRPFKDDIEVRFRGGQSLTFHNNKLIGVG